jgi:GT2 family glycosyltransferase/glycosyltransferase involved in cell wall biosynthesis
MTDAGRADGAVEVLRRSALFDAEWYKRRFPDAEALGMDPAEHYLRIGARLGRDPSPSFDGAAYLAANPDVAAAGMNPLLHFELSGRAEARPLKGAAPPPAVSPPSVFPDLFDLRASSGNSSRIAVAVTAPGASPGRFEGALDIVAADGDAIIVTSDPADVGPAEREIGRLGKGAVLLYPETANVSEIIAHLVNEGPLFRYETACLLTIGASGRTSDRKIAAAWREEVFAAGRLDETPPDAAPLIAAWFARLGREARAPALIAGGASIIVPSLLLHQFRAHRIAHQEFAGARAPLLPAMFGAIAEEAGIALETIDAAARRPAPAATRKVRTIAFYLPQFHPIPENDLWWGEGFTEWSNVVKAKPLFRGHDQPKLPADLGYYDLRTPETQDAQAAIARRFGVHGFCYYYYWFDGKKMLNRPVEQMLETGKPDFPFCVCWANENWSRNWDGQNRHVLLAQSYSMESNRALIREFIRLMRDPRYIRHDGKPVLIVYRIRIIPNWLETVEMWRAECRAAGVGEIHLCAVRFGLEPLDGPPQEFGLDAYVLFPPHETVRVDKRAETPDLAKDFNGEIFGYDEAVDGDLKRFEGGYPWPVHRGAMLGWDNTARRPKDSRIFTGASPARFRRWVSGIVEQEDRHNPDPNSLLFVNAWNEWAEGTALEPSQRFGRGYLAAAKSALGPAAAPAHYALAAPKRRWFPGFKARRASAPTILLAAHCVSHQLFGGERSFIDMLEALETLDVNVVVALPSAAHAFYTDLCAHRSLGVAVIPYAQWKDDRAPDEAIVKLFEEVIEERGVDLVYANTITHLEALAAARRLGKKTVVHARELIDRDEGLVAQVGLPPAEAIARVHEMADHIVANSAMTAKLFHRAGRTHVAPNVVDIDALDMENAVRETVDIALVSSNLPKKGVSDFIEVARRCETLAPNARFIVIGPENDFVARLKIEAPANVVFAGYAASPHEAMAQANVIMSLSHFAESFGRTVAEAHAARRPVIAYEWGAVGELVEDGVNGFLVPYGDIDAAAARVSDFCAEPALIARMGEAGRARVVRENAPARLAQNLRAALSEAVGAAIGKRPPAHRTTVIVPVYNAPDETAACLKSLRKSIDPRAARVLVINDGSADARIAPLLQTHARAEGFEVRTNEKNLGYTRTINLGVRAAGEDDIVLLNSDTIVTPGWLDGLIEAARRRDGIGTVTAMGDNAGAFSFPMKDRPNPKPDFIGHEEWADLILRRTCRHAPVEVPTGSGFCLYVRREVFDRIGLFDEEAFPRGYGEENDFCMRALKAGFRHVISPYAYVYHVRSASFGAEKEKLIKGAVETVMRRHPDYVPLVKAAFASPEMLALRAAAAGTR